MYMYSHENTGMRWLSDASLCSLAKALQKQLEKKNFQFHSFYNLIFCSSAQLILSLCQEKKAVILIWGLPVISMEWWT